MNAAWSAIIVALISGPLMWVLYRLDKRNTEQHGNAVELIREVRKDIKIIKLMQNLTNLSVNRQGEALEKHLQEHEEDATFSKLL